MNTGPVRVLLAVNMTVFLLVCVVYLLHHLDAGIIPGDVGAWLEDNQWLLWVAVLMSVSGALATPLISRALQQSGEDE
ncbi:hypothetical protein [Amycolatopsis suaedae]|uniref:Uncharacterized protein n=1 Tax=Amycolatopsis suaedae TaxID=2510978 RepID=A0A4Q7J6F5_9PSEU|nr:hypothetical protein [Amycolatopsis suaedae]RZQ62342.1 hypothetical protein EWH70_18885 [Amycolatopsis suaedae]